MDLMQGALLERAMELGRLSREEVERSFDLGDFLARSTETTPAEAERLHRTFRGSRDRRDAFTRRFGFAVPCLEAVQAIRAHAGASRRVLDPLAGSGYWARVLADAGCDVIATDDLSWHRPWTAFHFPVGKQDALESIREVGEGRLVLLCWATYSDPIGARCLRALASGQVVAVVGEGRGGCTGDDEMFDVLEQDFEDLEDCVEIPQFWGLHDYLRIARKK